MTTRRKRCGKLIAFAMASRAVPELTRRVGLERALLLALVRVAGGLLSRSAPSVMALFLGTAILSSAMAVGDVLLPVLVKRDFPAAIGVVTSCDVTVIGFVAVLATGTAVPISRVVPGGWHTALTSWVLPALVAAGCALAAGATARAGAPKPALGPAQRTPSPGGTAWLGW